MIDIDRPSTWRKFSSDEACRSCNASCCTMPVEVTLSDLIRLNLVSEDEVQNLTVRKIAKRLVKEKWITSYREATGLFMLTQKANRDCIFLDSKTRLCTSYSTRPDVCRQFPAIGPRPGYCPLILKKVFGS
ncbi:MAG: YkgJ family cysteine cluster protein [Bdellovibrionaceae bacterium]|nr:YkgJ family cysteine cluster protein [Pseudobdellovibrionaceae bacterium]